jgi:hypothetical protein
MGRVYSKYGGEERLLQVFGGKAEGKRPLRRPRRRWEDNIKKDIQEVGCGDMTGSSWLRMGTDGGNCVCGNERSGSIKYGGFLIKLNPVSFSRRTPLYGVSK